MSEQTRNVALFSHRSCITRSDKEQRRQAHLQALLRDPQSESETGHGLGSYGGRLDVVLHHEGFRIREKIVALAETIARDASEDDFYHTRTYGNGHDELLELLRAFERIELARDYLFSEEPGTLTPTFLPYAPLEEAETEEAP